MYDMLFLLLFYISLNPILKFNKKMKIICVYYLLKIKKLSFIITIKHPHEIKFHKFRLFYLHILTISVHYYFLKLNFLTNFYYVHTQDIRNGHFTILKDIFKE